MNGSIVGFRTIAGAVAALSIMISAAALPIVAQTERTPIDALPTAETVIARYVEAIGWNAVGAKITNAYSMMTFRGGGLTIKTTAYQALPDRLRIIDASPELGTTEQGYDGEIFWEKTPRGGPRILTGEERADGLRETAFNELVDWRRFYIKAELGGDDTVKGTPCSMVILTPEIGSPRSFSFDKDTGLLMKVSRVARILEGNVTLDSYYEDYRLVDGLATPFRITTRSGSRVMECVIDSVAMNIELPPDVFKLPDDVKALIKK